MSLYTIHWVLFETLTSFLRYFFPITLPKRHSAETQERRIIVINELRDGKDLPPKPLHHDWIIAIVFLAAYLWLIVRTTTRSIFPEITRFILFRGINESSSHDTGSLFTWQSTVLNFISFTVIGAVRLLCVRTYTILFLHGIPPFLFMLISLGFVIFAITSTSLYLPGSRKPQRRNRVIQGIPD